MMTAWLIKFRDGQTLQTIPTDLTIVQVIEQACIKKAQTIRDVTAVREIR